MSRNSETSNASGPTIPSVTKLCHIVKRPDFDGYGFNLHSEKIKPGQYIGKVDTNSPAEIAGLKEGDRIIEVNGVAIGAETHKQVVARIKAISCEVRLLLIDVDGKGDNNSSSNAKKICGDNKVNHNNNTNNNNNNNNESTTLITDEIIINNNNNISSRSSTSSEHAAYQGAVQELPGASANISSISVVSTKRISNASNQSNGSNSNIRHSHSGVDDASADETDKAANVAHSMQQELNGNRHIKTAPKTTPTTPPAPTLPTTTTTTLKSSNDNILASKPALTTPPPPSNAIATVPKLDASSTVNTIETSNSNGINKAGSLQLPMTAAEMRAKLMSKKKYDPKSDSVDLKKKFDIIQKL